MTPFLPRVPRGVVAPRKQPESTSPEVRRARWKESFEGWAPGLLDDTSPQEVVSASSALVRVAEDDDLAVCPRRSFSSPALLGSVDWAAPEQAAAEETSCGSSAPRSHSVPRTRSSSGFAPPHQLIWLIFLFVTLDASKGLAVSWAAVHGHMCAPLVICAKDALSIAFGLMLAMLIDGVSGVRQCFDLLGVLRILPVSACFCSAQILGLQALRAFDPGSLKVISQINLPVTAWLSWLVLGRQYSAQQVFAMLLLLCATMAFLQVRMLFFDPPQHELGDGESMYPAPDKVIGMMCFMGGIVLSSSASILAERFLKRKYEVPFYIQKTNLMLGELFVAFHSVRLSFGGNAGRDGAGGEMCSWEQIHDWRQMPVILIWLTHGWIAGLLVKRCSALAKNVSHIISALVTYFVPFLYCAKTMHFWPVTLSAVLVLVAVMVFATTPQQPHRDSGGRRRRTSQSEKRLSGIEEERADARQVPDIKRPNSEARLAVLRSKAAEVAAAPSVPDSSTTPLLQPPRRLPPTAGPRPTRGEAHGCFAPAKAETLPAPATAAARPRVHSVLLLIVSFILLDATKPILVTWAHQRRARNETFINGTFTLVQTALSLLVGLAFAAGPRPTLPPPFVRLHPDWRGRVRRCLNLRSVIQQLPVSCCFCLSKLFLVMALERLDAGTVRVFAQASLPLVGVSGALFFSRKYTAQQWCSLVAISIALVAFYYVKAESQLKSEALSGLGGRKIDIFGVIFILASIGSNSFGALLMEKFLKHDRGVLREQKSQILLGEIIINGSILFGSMSDPVNSVWARGFFAGWDRRVLICAMVWIPAGWTATTLVKHCSNLVKTIAQATSSALTYIFSVFPITLVGPALTPEPFSSPVVLLAVAVMLAALTFGTDTQPSASPSKEKALRGELSPRQRGNAVPVDVVPYAALRRSRAFSDPRQSKPAP